MAKSVKVCPIDFGSLQSRKRREKVGRLKSIRVQRIEVQILQTVEPSNGVQNGWGPILSQRVVQIERERLKVRGNVLKEVSMSIFRGLA